MVRRIIGSSLKFRLVVAAVADAPAETTALTVGSGGAAGNVVGMTVGPDA